MLDSQVWDELDIAGEAAERVVPGVVMRHRSAGILTWALLHQMEAEVLAELEASGEHETAILRMIRSAPVFGYPTDERPASFENASVVPVIFGQIDDAWKRVH